MIKKLRQYHHLEDRELIDKVVELEAAGNNQLDNGSILSLMLTNPVVYLASITIEAYTHSDEEGIDKVLCMLDNIVGDGIMDSTPHIESLISILNDENYNDKLIQNLCIGLQNPAEAAAILTNIVDNAEYASLITTMDKTIPVKYMTELKKEIDIIIKLEDEYEEEWNELSPEETMDKLKGLVKKHM